MGNENSNADVRMFSLPTAAAGCYRLTCSATSLCSTGPAVYYRLEITTYNFPQRNERRKMKIEDNT
jgi:hypothetical protein